MTISFVACHDDKENVENVQCDQIGQLLKGHGDKFAHKSSPQNSSTIFWDVLKMSVFKLNLQRRRLGNF